MLIANPNSASGKSLAPDCDDHPQMWWNEEILTRLVAIEDRLSRIERQLYHQQPTE